MSELVEFVKPIKPVLKWEWSRPYDWPQATARKGDDYRIDRLQCSSLATTIDFSWCYKGKYHSVRLIMRSRLEYTSTPAFLAAVEERADNEIEAIKRNRRNKAWLSVDWSQRGT